MAYDELLTIRFRDAIGADARVSEKRMMGGLVFMLDGHMLGGVDRDETGAGRFMFRVGKGGMAEALSRPGSSQVKLGGRPLGGFVFVAESQCDDRALAEWIGLATRFVATLPPK